MLKGSTFTNNNAGLHQGSYDDNNNDVALEKVSCNFMNNNEALNKGSPIFMTSIPFDQAPSAVSITFNQV